MPSIWVAETFLPRVNGCTKVSLIFLILNSIEWCSETHNIGTWQTVSDLYIKGATSMSLQSLIYFQFARWRIFLKQKYELWFHDCCQLNFWLPLWETVFARRPLPSPFKLKTIAVPWDLLQQLNCTVLLFSIIRKDWSMLPPANIHRHRWLKLSIQSNRKQSHARIWKTRPMHVVAFHTIGNQVPLIALASSSSSCPDLLLILIFSLPTSSLSLTSSSSS